MGELTAFISVDSSKADRGVSGFVNRMATAAGTASSKWSSVGSTFQNIGSKISSVGGGLTKGITLPAVGAAAAVGGIVGALGFKRLVGIDTARGQFKGLGLDADAVMKQVDKGVTDTSLSMAEGASSAVGILATGAVPLSGLEAQIKRVANVSAAYGVESEHANLLLNNVLTKNKVEWGDLSQMMENGIPITKLLADQMGVAQSEVQKLASDGKVSVDDLNDALDKGAGKAAKEYAKTWKGVSANVMSNLGKIGAAMLEPAFNTAKDELTDFLAFLKTDEVTEFAKVVGEVLGGALTATISVVKSVIQWFAGLPAPIQKSVVVLGGIAVAAGPVLLVLGSMISTIGTLVTSFGVIAGVIAKIPAPLNILGGLFRMISPLLGLLKVGLLAAGGAAKALWLTLMANPIVLIIAAIAAVVAALVWFFTQTETGKAIWQGFMDWLATAWEWIKTTAMTVFLAIGQAIITAWEWVKTTSANVWNGFISWLVGLWNGIIGTATATFIGIGTAIIAAWNWIKSTTTNIWNSVLNWIKGVWTSITTAVTNAGTKVGTFIGQTWNKIKATTSTIWNAVKQVIANAFSAIWNTAVNKVAQIYNKVRGAWVQVQSTTANAFNGVKNAVANGINGAVSFVSGLPGRVVSSLWGIGSTLFNSGWSLIDGFRRGIVQAFGNAVNAVKNGLSRIRNFFPFSPAKEGPFSGKGWTVYSGRSMSEGLASGLADGIPDVVRQTEAVMKAAAFDTGSVPGMTTTSHGASSQAADLGRSSNVTFNITNPVAEPTSETARKASAYIGVNI